MANINIESTWTSIKNLVQSVGTQLHYIENDTEYRIFTFNGQILYETSLVKDSGSVILKDPTQNDTDLADFENNFKSSANQLDRVKISATIEPNQEITIQNQTLTNKFRVVQCTPNQSISNGSYTTVYLYNGSGSLFGIFLELDSPEILLKVTVDSEIILDGVQISNIPVVGPGNSGSGAELSTGLWRSSLTELNFKPPLGLKYESTIKIELRGTKDNQKLVHGYISLTKVT